MFRIYLSLLLLAPTLLVSQIQEKLNAPNVVVPRIPDETIRAGAPDTLAIGGKYNITHYGLAEGLSSQLVRRIWMDSRKYIWIATYGGGISVFDGKKFSYLTMVDGLAYDIIWDFVEDEQGRIWIATDLGVCIYDGVKFDYFNEEDGLGAPVVWSLLRDSKDRIWMGTSGGGLSIYDEGKLTHHTTILGDTALQIYDFCESADGTIWFGTHGQSVFSYDGKEFQQHLLSDLPQANIIHSVTESTQDGKSVLWFGSRNGLFKYRDETIARLDTSDGLPHEAVFDLMTDRNGNLWVATFRGVVRLSGEDAFQLTVREGLVDGFINNFMEDDWGNIWLGYRSRGLARYSGEKFVHYSTETGFPGLAISVYSDSQNRLWVGTTENGFVVRDGNKFVHYGPKQGFKWKDIGKFEEGIDGEMWIGLRNKQGLVRFSNGSFEHYGQNLTQGQDMSIQTLKFTPEGLWVGTRHNNFRIGSDSIYFYMNGQNITDHYFMLDIFLDDQGAVWFGSHGGGAGRVSGDSVMRIDQTTGLATNGIMCIGQDNHKNYWFACNGEGLSILKAGSIDKPLTAWQWKYINTKNGLASNSIHAFDFDSEGNAWICTGRGLNKIVLTEDVFSEKYSIKYYGQNEGFYGIESEEKPVADSENNIWFVSYGELAQFNSSLDVHTKLPPKPVFTGLKIKLKEVEWSTLQGAEYESVNAWNNYPVGLSLPYTSNHLLFEFDGISYEDPEGVEFSWRLNGFDPEWSPWSKMRHATYANLPPGDFTFELMTRDVFGNASETHTYSFQIREAFWQSSWFRISFVAAIVLLVYLVFKWRTLALKRRQRVLEQTVEIRTLEINRQKEEIEFQKHEILDSITYAKRIQQSILPPDTEIARFLPEAFVFYKPKDIVAGDFYWIEQVSDYVFFAAADCTGHGVPGAMVSVICANALNTAVIEEKIYEPGKILDRVTALVVKQFGKGDGNVKDGMDVALCRWNRKTGEIAFSGAHNPLWCFRSDNTLEEIPADKQPVGVFDTMKPFTQKKISVQSGDRLYIFSDGFSDQFGGEKRKKYMTARLRQFLGSLTGMNSDEQRRLLVKEFEDWKGNLEQLDDVCIIGVMIA